MSIRHYLAIIATLVSFVAPVGWGHLGSINLFVDEDGVIGEELVVNQLYALETFALPQLQGFLNIANPEISVTGPGLSVNFPSQGVAIGTDLSVDISQDLKYWDGSGLAPTTAGIRTFAPEFDNQGRPNPSAVTEYYATTETGRMTGMDWGRYDGTSFWEAHNDNFLEPITAAPGIYGLVYQVQSSAHVTSEPFLIPFVYDPDGLWDEMAENIGATRLRESTAAHHKADVNDDGHVDRIDIDLVVADIATGLHTASLDLTGDGLVDAADLAAWRLQAGTANLPLAAAFLPGDANLDGVVDVSDFNIWNGSKFTSAAAWSQGDFNADGQVDVSDFNIWNGNKFASSLDVSPTAAVPEPAGHLLTIAAVSFVFFARRR